LKASWIRFCRNNVRSSAETFGAMFRTNIAQCAFFTVNWRIGVTKGKLATDDEEVDVPFILTLELVEAEGSSFEVVEGREGR
jgi:hypothetical protein